MKALQNNKKFRKQVNTQGFPKKVKKINLKKDKTFFDPEQTIYTEYDISVLTEELMKLRN